MKTVWALLLVVVLNHNISSSLPTGYECDQTLEISKVIQHKCSSFASSDIFIKQLEIVEGCPKWCQLKEIQELRKDNEKDVLCLLFANSLLSFCTSKNATLQNVDLIPPSQITVANVCTKLLPMQTTEFNISAIIPNKKACEIVCSNYYEDPPIVKECALAYRFASLSSSVIIADIAQKTNLTNSVTKDSPNDKKDSPEVDHGQSVQEQINLKQHIADTQKELGSVKPTGVSKTVNVNQKTKQLQQELPEQKKPSKPSDELLETVTMKESSQINSKEKLKSLQNDQGLNKAPADHQEPSSNNAATAVKVEPSATNPEMPSIKHKGVPGKDEESANNVQDHPPLPPHESVALGRNLPGETGGENTEPKIEDDEEEGIVPKEEETSPNERHNHLGYSRDEEEENTYDEEIGTVDATSAKKKLITPDEPASFNNLEEMDGESYFFSYFMVICVVFVLGYVVYHNRQKVLALVLEGKRSKRQYRGRRPNSANYHKLDTNLEEAISSNCDKNSSHVIY